MSVREWPRLPNLSLTEELRDALEEEREESGASMAEQMRRILCAHYDLRCEQVDYFGGKQPGGGDFTLRVSPEVFRALNRDKQKSGRSMRRLVLDIVSEHFSTEVTPA
jgi:hypothetical protein